ncbi:hypothetical protein [Desulfatibacillum aliphaticivorans]|uniref:hypothetical protein n=1 Tax=Desulfatibacillum aliphaticivorans TaxID=218208 RepID=UPI0004034332|nr:hypothetical protein [Desulfatibacillum aliphaticivorans]
MNSIENEHLRQNLEDFERIKKELGKIPAPQSELIAQTFHKANVQDIEYSDKNYETLKSIQAYETRKQEYFTKWLKNQQKKHAASEEEFQHGAPAEEETDEETSFFLILTVDLTGARPWAFAKLEKALNRLGFEKPSAQDERKQKRLKFPGFSVSANIYSAQVIVEDEMDMEPERDRINEEIKALMDREREKGSMEEYRYILFVSKQWSWQEEGTS